MPLTPDQQRHFREWLDEKGYARAATCPVCDKPDTWTLGDVVLAPRLDSQALQTGAQNVAPMIQMWCDNCGFMMLFQANVVGIGEAGADRGREQEPNIEQDRPSDHVRQIREHLHHMSERLHRLVEQFSRLEEKDDRAVDRGTPWPPGG